MDPDPGGPKTYGSDRSGSATLLYSISDEQKQSMISEKLETVSSKASRRIVFRIRYPLLDKKTQSMKYKMLETSVADP
jgi:hypothetical protein